MLWLLRNAGSSGRIHCASSSVRVRCSSTRYGRRNAGSLQGANFSRVRSDSARGRVHFVLPAVSVAPAPAVSAAPAPVAGCIAPVPAESVAPAQTVRAVPALLAEYISRYLPCLWRQWQGGSRQCLPSLRRQLQPSLLEYVAPTPAVIAALALNDGVHRTRLLQ